MKINDITRRGFLTGLAASAVMGSASAEETAGIPVVSNSEVEEIFKKTIAIFNDYSFGNRTEHYIKFDPSKELPKVYNFKDIPFDWVTEQFPFMEQSDQASFYHYNRNIIALAYNWDRYTIFHELVHYIQIVYQGQPPEVLNYDNAEMTARIIQLNAKKLKA